MPRSFPLIGLTTALVVAWVALTPPAWAACESGSVDCCRADIDCDDRNPCNGVEACDAATRTCLAGLPVANTPCDDGNRCTTDDHCDTSTTCVGTPTTCERIDSCHAAGTCDPATGLCSTPTVADGTPCPDGLFCNGSDVCFGGNCRHAGDPCEGGQACDHTCDENTSSCGAPRGSPCAPDGNPCTLDQCDGLGTCTHPANPDPMTCDDDNACTTADQCADGACTGTPRVCTAPDACHDAGTCDPQTGSCSAPALPDETPCPDELFCNGIETCQSGSCISSGDPCAAGAECQNVCEETADHCRAPAGAPCNDGDPCTVGDACSATGCGGSPKSCIATDPCHDDGVCNSADGSCVLPPTIDGTPCGPDEYACTIDACSSGTCQHVADHTRCDDGSCSEGVCQPTTPGADALGCLRLPTREGESCTDDGVACTIDRCQLGDCFHLPTDARCDSTTECGASVCSPERGDANGCAPALDAEEGALCSEDTDACSDDRCNAGGCTHLQVTPYATCRPVQGAWDRSRGLARNTRAMQTGMRRGGEVADPQFRDLLAEFEMAAVALEEASDILAGRRPAAAPVSTIETNGQRRARTALARVAGTPKTIARCLRLLRVPAVRTALGASAAPLVTANAKTLRRGIRQLIAELRRLQKFSKSLAR